MAVRAPAGLQKTGCCNRLRGIYSTCCTCGISVCKEHRVIDGLDVYCLDCYNNDRVRRIRPWHNHRHTPVGVA
jgi:hypothetical protein